MYGLRGVKPHSTSGEVILVYVQGTVILLEQLLKVYHREDYMVPENVLRQH